MASLDDLMGMVIRLAENNEKRKQEMHNSLGINNYWGGSSSNMSRAFDDQTRKEELKRINEYQKGRAAELSKPEPADPYAGLTGMEKRVNVMDTLAQSKKLNDLKYNTALQENDRSGMMLKAFNNLSDKNKLRAAAGVLTDMNDQDAVAQPTTATPVFQPEPIVSMAPITPVDDISSYLQNQEPTTLEDQLALAKNKIRQPIPQQRNWLEEYNYNMGKPKSTLGFSY